MGSHQFEWVSSGGTGYLGISEAEVRGDTLVWFTPGGAGSRTRYTIWKSAQGEWREVGEVSRDNQSWTRLFEMTWSRSRIPTWNHQQYAVGNARASARDTLGRPTDFGSVHPRVPRQATPRGRRR